jgi:hypothetical protein
MKELLEVRSNAFYIQTEGEKINFEAVLEVVLIHTDGFAYTEIEGTVKRTLKFEETRMLLTSQGLTDLIVQLQLHQKKLEQIRHNAEELTSIVERFNAK